MHTQKKGLSIRLNDEEFSAVETLAERYNVPMTQIIRWAIQAFQDYSRTQDHRITLPIDFAELIDKKARSAHLNEPGQKYNSGA